MTALFVFTSPAHAEGIDIRPSGYIKNFLIATESSDDSTLEALSRLRLRLDVTLSDSSSFEFAYELLPRIRERDIRFFSELSPSRALLSYRALDFDESIYPHGSDSGSDFELFHNFDRAYLVLSTRLWDISIGRQPVSFGSAHVINPSDIITPFTYNTIAKEELVGVDALRVRTPLADMGELDLGVVFGEDFEPEKSAAFVRLKTYQISTDISFMTMIFRENILLSIDLVRSIGGAGAWIEAAQTLAGGAADYRPEENYFRLSVGSDYSITSKLYAYIEYHYSGAGNGRSEEYLKAIEETAFTDGAVYLLGRHYLAPGAAYEITPILVFNANALLNLEDGSILASPGFEYSITQDIYFQLMAFIGIGEESRDPLRPENEFGLYPDIYYVGLNFYF
jgi:hypothetical protein